MHNPFTILIITVHINGDLRYSKKIIWTEFVTWEPSSVPPTIRNPNPESCLRSDASQPLVDFGGI